jgi:hypothetical protein
VQFTLTIDCNNDAFCPPHDDASEAERYTAAGQEVSRVLARFAASPHIDTTESGFLRDSNGNRCGQWSLNSDDEGEELDGMGNRLDGCAPDPNARLAAEVTDAAERGGEAAAQAPAGNLDLDNAELAAVLAGLRMIQARGVPDDLEDVATDGGRCDLPSDEFIDDLCDKLNGTAQA